MSKIISQGQLILNQRLADYTTWRVGGVARKLYKPSGVLDLANFLQQQDSSESLLWLGLGSNSLIKDNGFSGTVILTQGALNEIALVSENEIRVEAGVSCAQMARFCARSSLSGGEFWAGIPGTIGGALRMNAGCFNAETWDLVVEVETISRCGKINHRKPSDFSISYRHVEGLEQDEWFVAARFKLTPGDKQQSLQTIKTLLDHRAATQPTNEYNCGSVFRNPPKMYAAKLIESCQLKGKRLGGAMVSEKHANFIINHQGLASASDIESLILLVQNTVYQSTGIELQREVHILGDH